ncbi:MULTISPECIES: hypothetical protein [Bradyrhizobium]|uniref:hypothetical protein n=1 Tax=Bradyrhizobium TaxID=374 RepID=UPI0009B6BC7D|nr:hypothetical protein [Bradyrhizobium japonicum]MCS3537373.1 hypothetical protein [Bradyrhizobium japonicum]MCS3986540.1 hypothetical protein [Bradyrhizobium japonicum]MCS4018646.1 hypothetical protein [Bradyrhizobium japonicum]MCS4205752.1 hypothetical protein [Bradyrhizobium japonicum]MYV88193.1 hypothetical protein [Bradyrhizobium japonicum]
MSASVYSKHSRIIRVDGAVFLGGGKRIDFLDRRSNGIGVELWTEWLLGWSGYLEMEKLPRSVPGAASAGRQFSERIALMLPQIATPVSGAFNLDTHSCAVTCPIAAARNTDLSCAGDPLQTIDSRKPRQVAYEVVQHDAVGDSSPRRGAPVR